MRIHFHFLEEVCRRWDALADEDHSYHLSEQEYFYFKNKWWLHLNKSGSDTLPLRKRSDFKQALSSLERLNYTKKLEKNNSRPLLTGSTNNGNRHRVHLPPGGKKVNERGCKRRLVIDRGNPLFTEFWGHLRRMAFANHVFRERMI